MYQIEKFNVSDETDIANLKECFKIIESYQNICYQKTADDINDINDRIGKIQIILEKHSDSNFYLTYNHCTINDSNYFCNFKIHTEDEMKKKIPKNINISQLCFSNKNKPCKNMLVYPQFGKSGKIETFFDFKKFHNNLHIIHHQLLAVAEYFFI